MVVQRSSSIWQIQTCHAQSRTGDKHGMDRPFSVSTAVRLHGFVSHYFSIIHNRACGLADSTRSILSDHRNAGLSPPLRILAQDIRRDVWLRRCLRNRACIRVWHELEPAVGGDGTDSGAIADLRELYRL